MHRDSQKRIYGDYIYFVTCMVKDKSDFFRMEILCELWRKELNLAKEIHQFDLYAFCLNYDHFHLLFKPNNKVANYSKVMHFLKRHFTRNANIILCNNPFDYEKSNNQNILPEGDVDTKHIIRSEGDIVPKHIVPSEGDVGTKHIVRSEGDVGTKYVVRSEGDVGQRRLQDKHPKRESWQIEMDKFVLNLRKSFLKTYGTHHNIPKFQWQKSFYDHVIRNQHDFENHWNYTMYNFRKHGLPENWKYTGLNFPNMIDKL